MTIFKRNDFWLFVSSVLLFTLFPSIDLWLSSQFFTRGFELQFHWLANAIYLLFADIHLVLFPLLLILAFRGYKRYTDPNESFQKRIYLFLSLSLLLGPGLFVMLIKDFTIGRARPSQITDFGGSADFTRAFEYSGACDSNCSFVSGHAAMGFFFIGLGWLMQSKRWFYIGLVIGAIVGLTRIVQGGHFLSDTVFALWAIYWVNLALGKLLNIKSPL